RRERNRGASDGQPALMLFISAGVRPGFLPLHALCVFYRPVYPAACKTAVRSAHHFENPDYAPQIEAPRGWMP
ncbi:hypothetical protein, partial [Cronobacter sakazakii]|uniref:hypothetical protein n=1 Tax=Cronobacter sakazakii TaxID=28141 RepID=UPI0020CAC7B8